MGLIFFVVAAVSSWLPRGERRHWTRLLHCAESDDA
jgi:hypothetical protein